MSGQGKYLVAVSQPREAAGDKPSASAVYRHAQYKDGNPKLEVATLFELFTRSVEKFPNNECLGRREIKDGKAGAFTWMSYKEVAQEVEQLASGLRAIGVAPKSKIGIFGANSPEWMMAMQACNRMNMVCTPLYDSLGENAIEYIINHAECTVAFTSSEKFPALAKALPKVKGLLKAVVYWGKGNEAAAQVAKDSGFELLSFEELKAKGKEQPAEPVPPSPEDLCTIMYTSGTTGDPKGVMLKHSAVLGGVANCHFYMKANNIFFNPPDRVLSYLPLAHIFDRVVEELFLMLGCSIGYWQGDVLKLVDDIAELKPALFTGVPRVFDRIYTRIAEQIRTASVLKRLIFNWGFTRKLFFMKAGKGQAQASPFFDRLVFSKIAQRLGGKVRAIVTGGAPLAPHVEEFLRVTMCCPVVQGYGLTETSASSFITSLDVMEQMGMVGPPTPCTEMKLESVPEMNYNALDAVEPKGEVLIRSPANFTGYFKQQDMTDEVLEKDGWFHTGDIGVLTKQGALKIIDRKKNIFKLSQGEYVAVEKLENTYKKCTVVEQVWVYGNSFKSCLVAVVVPSESGIKAWAAANGVAGSSVAEICADPKAKAHVLAELVAIGKADKLKGFELIKAVHLESALWTIEEDLLTPTFKLKRPQLLKKYQSAIDAMYVALKE